MTPLIPENSSSPVTPDSSAQTNEEIARESVCEAFLNYVVRGEFLQGVGTIRVSRTSLTKIILAALQAKAVREEKEQTQQTSGLKEPSADNAQTVLQKATRYFLDTEFIEAGRHSPVQLISIGIVSEDGREFYAESQEFDPKTLSPWLKENVLPHLGPVENRKPVALIAKEIRAFIGDVKPEFWGYYADYDWVVFCQMFGSMIDLPKGWPMYCRDIKQLCDALGNPKLPENVGAEHNALSDAKWNEKALQFLLSSHSNETGAPPISPSPSSLPPQSQGSEQGDSHIIEADNNCTVSVYGQMLEIAAKTSGKRLTAVITTRANAVALIELLMEAHSVGCGPDEHLAAQVYLTDEGVYCEVCGNKEWVHKKGDLGHPFRAPLSKEVPVGAPKELLEAAQDAVDWLMTARADTQEHGIGVRLQDAITASASAPSPLQTQGRWTVLNHGAAGHSIMCGEERLWTGLSDDSALHISARHNASLKDDKDTAKSELLKASFASCTCNTKTPDIAYHDELCKYRILESARIILSESPVPAASEVEEKQFNCPPKAIENLE